MRIVEEKTPAQIKESRLKLIKELSLLKVDNSYKKHFGYGYVRSANSTVYYLKAHSDYIREVIFENTNETLPVKEAMLKVRQSGKNYDVNSLPHKGTAYPAVVYLKF